jgi:hypothetical protein
MNPLMQAGHQQQSQMQPTQQYAVQPNAFASHQYPSTPQQQWAPQAHYATDPRQVPPAQPMLVQHQPQGTMQGVTSSQYQPQPAKFQQVQPASVASHLTQSQQDRGYFQPTTHQTGNPGVPMSQHANQQPSNNPGQHAPMSQPVPLPPNHIHQEQHMAHPSHLPYIQQQQPIVTPNPQPQPDSAPTEEIAHMHQGSHIQPQNQLPQPGNHIQPTGWKLSEEPVGTPAKPIEGTGIDAPCTDRPKVSSLNSKLWLLVGLLVLHKVEYHLSNPRLLVNLLNSC